MPDDLAELCVPDAAAWRAWLSENHARSRGVWLELAKKGTTEPTSLVYEDAVLEALCFGWIDGQTRRGDTTFSQRYTPRRPRSPWAKSNVERVQRLVAEGRMQPAGLEQVELAKADGRWEKAYAGPAAIEVPADLTSALTAEPRAHAMFEILTSQNRYAILYRLTTAKKPETRTRRLEQFVAMLARGETIYPQKRRLPD